MKILEFPYFLFSRVCVILPWFKLVTPSPILWCIGSCLLPFLLKGRYFSLFPPQPSLSYTGEFFPCFLRGHIFYIKHSLFLLSSSDPFPHCLHLSQSGSQNTVWKIKSFWCWIEKRHSMPYRKLLFKNSNIRFALKNFLFASLVMTAEVQKYCSLLQRSCILLILVH